MINNQPKKEFVILFHGLGRSKNAMAKMQMHFLQAGYSVWNKSYPSRKYPIEELVPMTVAPAIDFARKQGADKVHLVGHSLGGILIRYYLQNNNVPELGNVVLIACPNHGTELADFLMRFSFVCRMMGPVLSQLGTSKNSVPNQIAPISANIGCIAGNRSSDPWFSLFIPGQDDGKVPVQSAKLASMNDFILLHKGHTFIQQAPQTLYQTQFFIENGHFDHAYKKMNNHSAVET